MFYAHLERRTITVVYDRPVLKAGGPYNDFINIYMMEMAVLGDET